MGIHGIYKEIGPGRRVALSKLAVDKFEETGRPLRIAIDTSIWLFQIQASKGGTNPALRTFYYRLLRLIALSIHPVFVFDGPNKPPFKRNKRTGPNVASIPEFLAKQLLKQFGYPIHLAPGEAEAECALLQREGIVDAVLSEDVDTLMFGSGITIRNWSPEKTGKTPTHVSVYDAVETKNGPSGLDREGMILVAMMSGGDYVPEGIPGCGPKTACEAAKAGFGSELCKIPRNDTQAMSAWRLRLQHELKTNESKMFKRKHGALSIPDDFPRLDILGYYTHPAISSQTGLDKLRRSIKWDQDIDFAGLREFTGDAFDWVRLEGAKHFIRSLAPSLLVRQLRVRAGQLERLPTDNLSAIQEDEALLIKGIHGKRQHPITDNSVELRVSFTPIELVKIDLDQEEPDEDIEMPPNGPQAVEADLDEDLPLDLEDDEPKKRDPTKFDPEKPARVWVMESIVKVGVPLKVQDWEAERQTKLKPRRAATPQGTVQPTSRSKPAAKKTKAAEKASQAPINRFAKVTKPGVRLAQAMSKIQGDRTDNADAQVSWREPIREQDVVNLLSSPEPSLPDAPALPPPRQASIPLEIENLPPSVTKRRRRGPIQRSQTLPSAGAHSTIRPSTPPLRDTIETLDLLSSPLRPSPAQLPAKKAKIKPAGPNSPHKPSQEMPIASSPGRSRQMTLDAWRASATPTKLHNRTDLASLQTLPAPPQLCSTNTLDTLDLTLTSPQRKAKTTKTKVADASSKAAINLSTRAVLASKSSNISRASSGSSSSSTAPAKGRQNKAGADIVQRRRASPRLRKSSPAPQDLDTLDLATEISPIPNAVSPPLPSLDPTEKSPQLQTREIDSLDLTLLSSSPNTTPPPETRRSPRNHKSTSPAAISPPTAWKAREKKKRQIILRKSVLGAWDYVDVDDSPAKTGEGIVLEDKERKKWRESEVQVIDLS